MQERQSATKFIEQGAYSERQYINRTIKIVGMQCNLNKIKEMRGAKKQHNDEIRNAKKCNFFLRDLERKAIQRDRKRLGAQRHANNQE